MPLKFDPEYLQALEPLMPVLSKRRQAPPAVNDIATRRANTANLFSALVNFLPSYPDVEHDTLSFKSYDGAPIDLIRVRRPALAAGPPTAAIVHAHGGGMIAGTASMFSKALDWYAQHADVQFFSVDYRLAPEHKHTSLVEDCYAALKYVSSNAQSLNIDPSRLGVLGDSAGGGIMAGTALMARDKDLTPPLAKQILIYPMLDDQNIKPNKHLEALAIWKSTDNLAAWTALLGNETGKDKPISPYSAPTRAQSLTNMPPTYIEVGELDIFKDEDVEYAMRLSRAGVSTELHLYPGVPHAFDVLAPNIDVTKRAMEHRLKAMSQI